MTKRLIFLSFPVVLAMGTAGCSLVSKIPGVSETPGIEVASDEDAVPVTPANGLAYTSDRTLQVGDVVGVAVYHGLRSSSKYFDEEVIVQADGTVVIGKYGSTKVLGLRAGEAAKAIGSEFLRSARTSGARLTVHITSVNGSQVVRVDGLVGNAGTVLWNEGMTVKGALAVAGGKRAGAAKDFVYVSSRGVRKTLVLDGMRGDVEADTELKAGDIVEVPRQL